MRLAFLSLLVILAGCRENSPPTPPPPVSTGSAGGATGDASQGFLLDSGRFHPRDGSESKVPSEAILAHLEKLNSNTVIVDYPENIESAGLTCSEVLQAAVFYLDHGQAAYDVGPGGYGFWARGEIRLQAGTYRLEDQWDVPGRVCVTGNGENVRDAGTVVKYLAGGNLQTGGAANYVIKSHPTDGVQHDGAFYCNIRDLSVECEGVCSGIWWGGAQCSSARRIQVRNVAANGRGFHLGSGSNGFSMIGVWVDGALMADNRAFSFGSYIHGIAMIGCKAERSGTAIYITGATQLSILGFYNESCDLPMDIYGGGGTTTVNASGFCTKASTYRSGEKAVIVRTTQDSVQLSIDGQVRHISNEGAAVEVGALTASGFVRFATEVKENGDICTFRFDQKEYFEGRPRNLNSGTELTWGRRYHDTYGSGADVTYSLVLPKDCTRQRDCEVYIIATGTCTLRFPSAYVTGAVGASTSVTLTPGNHVLRFADVDGTIRLTVD